MLVDVIAAARAQGGLTADTPGQVTTRAVTRCPIGINVVVLAAPAGATLQMEFATGAGGVAVVDAAIVGGPEAVAADSAIRGVDAVRRRGAAVVQGPVVGALVGIGAPVARAVVVRLAAVRRAIAADGAGASIFALAPGVVAPAVAAAHAVASSLVPPEVRVVAGLAVAVIEQAVVTEHRTR